MRIALDHHYSPIIAEQLRSQDHDVVAAVERGWHQDTDDSLLGRCTAERRVLVTNNVGDFMAISRQWATQGRSHAGLIFTSDPSLPRTRRTIGKYVELLAALLLNEPDSDAWEDRIYWL